MPELPEVERFRRILLPLVRPPAGKKPGEPRDDPAAAVTFELVGPADKLPRKWASPEAVDSVNQDGPWHCRAVPRKGKQLCMVLENSRGRTLHFYLHMGMTGRLISPSMSCSWGHKYVGDTRDVGGEWPPRFTYLVMSNHDTKVAFADPRKFGGCYFSEPDGTETSPIYNHLSSSVFEELAPDGLLETATPTQREVIASNLAHQRLGIKALILDQKRVVSGVGNWVADEVLYQCEIHPDQGYLTDEQAAKLVATLHDILQVSVDCLDRDEPYPDAWLFGYRWTKKQAGKDHKGRNLTFLTSGGRTSAIVASIQKLRRSQGKAAKATTPRKNGKKGVSEADATTDAGEPPSQEKRETSTSGKDAAVTSEIHSDKPSVTPSPRKKRKTLKNDDSIVEKVLGPPDEQRRRVRRGMRVRVWFDDGVWYEGSITGVLSRGHRIKIRYDDGTEEVAGFPDKDIVVDDLNATDGDRRRGSRIRKATDRYVDAA